MAEFASVSDLVSGTQTESTDSGTSGSGSSSSRDKLARVVDEVGGDIDGARAYVDEHGGKDKLVEFVESLDDDLMEIMETYRYYNDCVKRIDMTHLRNRSESWSAWRQEAYGDSDDPEPGTHNYARNQSRDNGGNLMYYKAIFPEPQMEYWPGEEAVVWEERPNEDSHVYVSREWAEEFADFAREINGEMRPVPPSDSDIESMAGDTDSGGLPDDAPFDPADFTVDELKEEVRNTDYSAEQLTALTKAEKAGDDRKTAHQELERQLAAVDPDEAKKEPPASADSSGISDAEERMMVAGRLKGEHGLETSVAGIAGMLESMSEEEVVETLA